MWSVNNVSLDVCETAVGSAEYKDCERIKITNGGRAQVDLKNAQPKAFTVGLFWLK